MIMKGSYILLLNTIKLNYLAGNRIIFIKNNVSYDFLNILIKIGYVGRYVKLTKNYTKIYLIYFNNQPVFKYSKLISKPSQLQYSSYEQLQQLIKYDFGSIYIISTSHGLLTAHQAVMKKTGGLIICKFFS